MNKQYIAGQLYFKFPNLKNTTILNKPFKCPVCSIELSEDEMYIAAIEQYIKKQISKQDYKEPSSVYIDIIVGGE